MNPLKTGVNQVEGITICGALFDSSVGEHKSDFTIVYDGIWCIY